MPSVAAFPLPSWALPHLPEEEQQLLFQRFRAGDRTAGDRLIRTNAHFVKERVWSCVGWALRSRPDLWEEFLSEGFLGFSKGLTKYETGRGTKIISYCVNWIDAYVTNFAVRHLGPLVLGKSQEQRFLFFHLNDPALQDDPRVQELKRLYSPAYCLDAPYEPDGGAGAVYLRDAIPDPQAPADEVLSAVWTGRAGGEQLRRALARLPERERAVLERRYLSEDRETLLEIGRDWGVSRERVRQLETRALRNLLRNMGMSSDFQSVRAFHLRWDAADVQGYVRVRTDCSKGCGRKTSNKLGVCSACRLTAFGDQTAGKRRPRPARQAQRKE